MAKIYGTWTYFNGVFNDDYDDTLFGTAENDIIYGLGGDDVINLEGRFLGNPLFRGIDEAYGGDGNDKIFGSSSRDILDGGEGLDQLYGGDGDDDVHGGGDTDWLLGEDGNDDLFGGDGPDQLYGGEDYDELYGGELSDWLDGGPGDDVLMGGESADNLTGGSGLDQFAFAFENLFVGDSWASNPDKIWDFNHNYDTIVLEGPGFDPLPNTKYVEDTIGALHGVGAGYDAAKIRAESLLNGDKKYAFVTDQVDGYLFVDWAQDETEETFDDGLYAGVEVGIILKGLTSVGDFDWSNIL
jgi:Ca2+-binding RTX toxin-like protein